MTMLFDVPANPSHPAKYTDALLPVMASMLRGRRRILDPFGGTGGAFRLEALVPGAAAPVRVETTTEPVMVSPADEAVEALRQRKPALVWPHERDAVLAALSAERVTS